MAAIADACDPLAVQRRLAAAMLAADAPALGVYYVDDHFVPCAGAELKQIPVKISANQLHPGWQRALPAIGRRTFQMVLRMLAYNSELWLADRLNAYLRDPNEYRTLTRSLFQLHGTLDYQPKKITVTLDPPSSPRLARALTLLIDEINQTPPHLPGDPRPITYHITPTQQ